MSVSVVCLFDTMAAGWFDRNMPNRPGLFLAREFIDPLGRLRKKVLACRKGLDGLQKLSPSR